MILKDLQTSLEERLSTITNEYLIESKLLLEGILGISRIDLILDKERLMTPSDLSQIEIALERRLKREPIQYILGTQDFMGLTFKVTPHVLIPRQDTESLVEYAQVTLSQLKRKACRDLNLLDIGTGSGAIAISLAKLVEGLHVTALDISAEALAVAKENAASHGLLGRMTFVVSDLFENVESQGFDLIISNPPYIPDGDRPSLEPEVSQYEPSLALFEREDGLGLYRKMIPQALAFLNPGGFLMFEAGHDQGDRIADMMRAEGYQNVHLERDLRGIPRFIIGQKQ